MEGKLIKVENGYVLMVDNIMHATDNDKLSLKNCEAIANGYDLDEVVEDIVKTIVPNDRGEDIWYGTSMAVGKLCFQKALEILGDKKFSESNLRIGCSSLLNLEKEEGELSEVFTEKQYRHIDNYIQSLQQTEWDVTFNPDEKDSDGCLILKRK